MNQCWAYDVTGNITGPRHLVDPNAIGPDVDGFPPAACGHTPMNYWERADPSWPADIAMAECQECAAARLTRMRADIERAADTPPHWRKPFDDLR